MTVPYSIVALDVDGTLLTDDHVLTEGTKDAVRRAAEAGVEIVLCTGRAPASTLFLLEEMGLSGIVITHNGAATIRSEDQSLLHSYGFQTEDIRELVHYCRAKGIHIDVNTVFRLFVDELTPEQEDMYKKFNIVPELVEDICGITEPIFKVTISGSEESLDRLAADWANVGCRFEPIRSGAQFIDVMHPDASKGNALRHLAAVQNVPRERILAIGNYFNDVGMLQFAGLGVAMENSPDPVKEASDQVTGSNNADGVRQALIKYFHL